MSDELTEFEQDLDNYLTVAFAAATGGFSKGTANVSARDVKKLRPLMAYYAKKPHPFRACVADNRKRFGPATEKYCAVLKDLIEGNTKWRNQGKKKGLSDTTLQELYTLDIPDGFVQFLSELDEEEVEQMMIDENEIEFAQGDIAWEDNQGYNALVDGLELALNGVDTAVGYDEASSGYGTRFWVKDIYVKGNVALVCEGGIDYYVVGYSQEKGGKITVDEESDWKPVSKAWVEEKVGFSNDLMAEMFFSSGQEFSTPDAEGLIWKPVMRTGTWQFSPGSKGAVAKPIKVVKDGKSDKKSLVISLEELKSNFENQVVEHVTIPTSHDDKVDENTGFIKKLRLGKDENGNDVLEAGHFFTEPEIQGKVQRGSIANTSAGIQFDFIHKESGKKYGAVLGHVALTNRPWLNGMKPFGVNASDDLEVIGFSEQPINDDSAHAEGGEGMTDTIDFSEFGFSSADELKAALEAGRAAQAEARERAIADTCRKWQEDGKSPALVAEAQELMMADEGATVINFSEGGKTVSLSASEIITRLVEKSDSVKLTEEVVTEADLSQEDEGEEEELELSREEKNLATTYFLDDGLSMKDAEAKVRAKRAAAAAGN